jgi:hypothetical protein
MLVPLVWASPPSKLQSYTGRKFATLVVQMFIHRPSDYDLCAHFSRSKIFVTVGSDEKVKFCEDLGATKGFNYKNGDWVKEVEPLSTCNTES